MGTKNNPGEFDCYAAAEPDEEMFILLARDPLAPLLVSMWAAARANDGVTLTHITDQLRRVMRSHADDFRNKPHNQKKIGEARACAAKMAATSNKYMYDYCIDEGCPQYPTLHLCKKN